MAKKHNEKSANPIVRGVDFVGESWRELKKVQIPSRQETIQMTLLVLAVVVVFALFLGMTDLVIGRIMGGIIT